MAATVKAMDQFRSAFQSALKAEEAKRGLGKLFHEAVITLLNENPNATPDELVALFKDTVVEVENTLMGALKTAFGEDAEPKDLGSWTQYKSNYKRALEMVDRRDIMKCTGPGQINIKLNEVRKALNEKANGGAATDSNPTDNGAAAAGGAAAGAGGKVRGISSNADAIVAEAMAILAKLPEAEQAQAADVFKNHVAARLRKLGKGNKKVGATVAGGGDRVAVNH